MHPTVYCSEAIWQQCKNAFAAQGVAAPEWWIAGYPGSVGEGNLYPGSVAHQYKDVGPYDVSAVADYWPGVDTGADDMTAQDMATLGQWFKDTEARIDATLGQWLKDTEARINAHTDAKFAALPPGGGLTADQVTAIVRGELDKTKLAH
jgi:hypothetical protein